MAKGSKGTTNRPIGRERNITERTRLQQSGRIQAGLAGGKDRFVRGFTQKMLTYALGRSVGATDRELVDGIVQELERDDYRMQSLLQAVVAGEAFRMK